MKKFKSLIAAFVVALLSMALIMPIAACDHNEGADGKNAVYVTSAGGMALKDVTVELLNRSTSLGLKKTDKDGKVSYNLDAGTNYTVKLSDVPPGFVAEASYGVKGSDLNTYIRLNSQVIESGKPQSYYTTGDVMYDFEETWYTYADGETKTLTKKLSEVFAEGKKAVLLNFFYNTCTACEEEYPAIKAAYLKYADKLEILGINEMSDLNPGESVADLKALVRNDTVPYLMCKDNALVGTYFREITTGRYPTSIMIDRYGIVCEWMVGNNTTQSFWEGWFEKYTRDDYSHDITQGETSDEIFVPDVPGDFGAAMPASSELNTKINNTGRNIYFSADKSNTSMSWPWDLTEVDDKTAIYPTNSGHRGTFAIIYAQIDLKANEVLAFDYKLSTLYENDYFYVSIDSRESTGRQISMTSGVEDWQTGYAYAALEDGTHEIEFTYYRSTSSSYVSLDDKVYINNLRIVTVDEMNEDLTAREETFEIPYFATRSYNNDTKQFDTKESVYLADDGYYHVGTAETATDSDPYLMVDITHATPYFGSNAESLYYLYSTQIQAKGGMYINNKDYTDEFASYLSYSTNSLYYGLIPVTQEIADTLTALYNDNIPKTAPYYDKTGYGWLQFCVSYRQYGVQKELTDPIKGLAYFSAFEAFETTGLENYVEVEKGTGQFIFDEDSGKFIDVEGTSRANEGNYDLNEGINQVHFNTIIMPRGYLYKFVPDKTGAYSFNGLDCYYINETETEEAIVDGEETDAYLFDSSLKLSHAYSQPIAASDSDRYDRNETPSSFKIIYYLEAGETYYIDVSFRVVETIGDFAFRIDYLGETYSYIYQATSNFYTLDQNNQMTVPLYCDPYYDEANDVWRDRKGNGEILLDFTQLSNMFDTFTIEQILDEDVKTAQFTFELDKDIVYTTLDEDGEPLKDDDGEIVQVTLHFDLITLFGGEKNIPEELQGLQNKITDYTDVMKEYLAKSKEGKSETDEDYGLLPVNAELYGILQLFNAKFLGYDTPTEWLKACCFRVNLGPTTNN